MVSVALLDAITGFEGAIKPVMRPEKRPEASDLRGNPHKDKQALVS